MPVGSKPGVATADALGVALAVVAGDVEPEGRPRLQLDRTLAERPDADLGALQVDQQPHLDARLLGRGTQLRDARTVLVRAAVGEVDAGDVHPRREQRGERFRGVDRWAERGDDLGPARHGR
jgi:hypothetical protein